MLSAKPGTLHVFSCAFAWHMNHSSLTRVSVSSTFEFFLFTDSTVAIPFLLLKNWPSRTLTHVRLSSVFTSCAASCMVTAATVVVALWICLWFRQLLRSTGGGIFILPRNLLGPVRCFPMENMVSGNLLLAS